MLYYKHLKSNRCRRCVYYNQTLIQVYWLISLQNYIYDCRLTIVNDYNQIC